MIVPDANLLLYAYNTASPFHTRARDWWEACLSGSEPVGLTQPVIFAFVRIGTSARVFTDPLTLDEASEHVKSWIERRITYVLQPHADYVDRVLSLLAAVNSAGGNLVTDAQIAALAIAYRAVVHTADRDFLRFPGLSCHYPLD
ncbi:TA system VapC family ribonuclease toxin [Candidatus Entotheonella palauensis]|uniref:TA system VapC family ribonuclease toxin n=1 Tax=Candidatus Entotheonella palauensis TaxID=93172 RepID=UPI0015C4AF83|nr:TA system VapC family ribonuclease toxin [Candidatus Entotheonella palauensis]